MPSSKATQDFVPIKEIRNGMVILKDNSIRAVLMASSINFALKSEDLQQSIITQFQSFLNSLDFSVEIFIQSRRLDIRPYLAQLEERYKVQLNELLKVQIREYINFIHEFTDGTNIMTKHFFVVVPYATTLLAQGEEGVKEKIMEVLPANFTGKKKTNPQEKDENFTDEATQLEQRIAVVEQGLIRSGVRTARLGTEELVEFYYKLFNPGEKDKPAKVTA
ncbi:MAG TPA: hypothetical protein VJI33_02910 [Candidatus Paceibacterota bacterium]